LYARCRSKSASPRAPPRALGDVLAGKLDVHPAELRAETLVDGGRDLELLEDVLEAARLESALAGLGVAVHRIADPEHRMPGRAHGLDGLQAGAVSMSRAP
jgi:hypothetical protein